MPHRAVSLALAILGLAAVAAIALVGVNVYRAAETGPRWRRQLLGAGLALLAALGVLACERTARTVDAAAAEAQAAGLAETAEWKHLVATWHEAEEVASGKRGPYPFDRTGKEQLFADLAQVGKDVEALQQRGLLSEAEAGLLKVDLARLTGGVLAKRPTELRMATCYKPMRVIPAQDSLTRLAARLPLLERLAASARLQPKVVRKILASAEGDLGVLAREEMLRQLPEPDRARAKEVGQAVAAEVTRLKARLGGGSGAPTLEDSADWKAITDAWAFATPLAKSGKSTTAQRKAADAKLKAASEAAQRLAEAGLLAPEEAQLLVADATSLREDIYRDPPTDSPVLCYEVAYLPPARRSLEGLAYRLPLVEKLVARGTIHASAAAKIIATIEADLAVLEDAKQFKELSGEERAKARAVRDQVRVALERLRCKTQAAP